MWGRDERDFHLFGQELVAKYSKKFEISDLEHLVFMVSNNSWWDTVDFIAVKLMGAYFKLYPEQRAIAVEQWLNSENIWLQRSALLFQLKYKTEIDVEMMKHTIEQLLGSKEFFINKAIGWVLREYSRTNAAWVLHFAESTKLHPLSRREALRLIQSGKCPINE